jgi:hypothetical protein
VLLSLSTGPLQSQSVRKSKIRLTHLKMAGCGMLALARVPDSQSNCDVLSRLMREAMQQFEGLFWNTALKPSEEILNRPQHIVRTLHRGRSAI